MLVSPLISTGCRGARSRFGIPALLLADFAFLSIFSYDHPDCFTRRQVIVEHYRAIHLSGVLHGDPRSANWLISRAELSNPLEVGSIRIIDFNLARTRAEMETDRRGVFDEACDNEMRLVRSKLHLLDA